MKLAAMMFAVALAGVTLGQDCGSPCAKSCGVRADNELAPEKELSFRHRLEEVHEPGLRDLSQKAGADEFAFVDGSEIAYVGEPSPYMTRAIGDFVDFMKVSMGLRLNPQPSTQPSVRISTGSVEKGYEVEVGAGGVSVRAKDDRRRS